jgi:hypothetical protein
MGDHSLARRGGDQPAIDAVEQTGAEVALDRRQPPRRRGLVDAETPRRRRQCTGPRDGQYVT